ncbi:MAG: DUF2911 domain-containing protein [Flavobacteriaceae bacterium]|nr:DUF2911 domain-containing protein [Flavobacteriaceae bacterium]
MKLFILLPVFFSLSVNAQLKTPSLSPPTKIEQTIGLTKIVIDYSRPSTRGRVIFGKDGLLPHNELWRTGANNATKITFSTDVSIDKNKLEKGNYTILTIPKKDVWQLNWYPYEDINWNTYIKKEPLLVLIVPVNNTSSHIETFEIHFQDITLNSASLILEWEHSSLRIPIQINQKEKVLKNIEVALAGPNSFDYFFAALYLHETKIDLNKALEYIQKATSSDNALFFQVTREALILKDLKKNKEALIAAKRGLSLSEKVGNNDFIRLNKKIIQELSL